MGERERGGAGVESVWEWGKRARKRGDVGEEEKGQGTYARNGCRGTQENLFPPGPKRGVGQVLGLQQRSRHYRE